MKFSNALALDIGEKRIGLARVNAIAKLPEPLGVLATSEFDAKLPAVLSEHDIDLLVVGLPRNMSGEETAQSATVRQFAADHLARVDVEYVFHDETLSSVRAEEHSKDDIQRFGIDSLAAVEILTSFLRSET